MDQMARAIANLVMFLEFSPQDILDEDAAMQALEQLAGDLNALDESSQHALSASFRSIASNYEGEDRTFVEQLPEALGLHGTVGEDQPE
ncbi:hypothetical protein BXU08_10970 [Sphingomonas sp. LM7]|nr:hypothetical protein BXU08_10970 [Sphingomonas sp. LM7]